MNKNTLDLYSNIHLNLVNYLLLPLNPSCRKREYSSNKKIPIKKSRRNFKIPDKNLGFDYFFIPTEKKSITKLTSNKNSNNSLITNISSDHMKNNIDEIDLMTKKILNNNKIVNDVIIEKSNFV